MVADKNKGITEIQYNHANLPLQVVRDNTSKPENNGRMKYYYSAAGQKLMTEVATTVADGASIDAQRTRTYLGGMVLKAGEIEFIGTEEGRALTLEALHKNPDGNVSLPNYITGESTKFRYEYQLKDHLGNLRVACRCGDPKRKNNGDIAKNNPNREPIKIVQLNDYDAWGLDFGTPPEALEGSVDEKINHRFLYNGKEKISDLGIENYDYGARMYEPAIGRWQSVDKKAELYFANSSFNYALNNPINAIDPDGNLVIFINGLGGGGQNYWKSWTNTTPIYKGRRVVGWNRRFLEFDVLVMDQLNDHKARYFDGSPSYLGSNISSFFRYSKGWEEGKSEVAELIESLDRDPQGNITESIKIITHSMGGVYAKGFVEAIKNYIRKSKDPRIRKVLIELVADFDPFQAGSIKADPDIHTLQFKNKGWWDLLNAGWLANQDEDGVEMLQENKNKSSHFIETFVENISQLQPGEYSWNENKQKWICTSCK